MIPGYLFCENCELDEHLLPNFFFVLASPFYYGVEWDRARLIEFCSILGLTMGAKVSVSLGVRQLPKLIPGYGQTIGAATAATLSFASTFALGRAAGLYLFHLSAGRTPNVDELKNLYREAFALARRTT